MAHDAEEPLIWSHNRVEGKREYTSLLYVPAVAPFDLWNREAPKGVKLYVQRVFITDQATQFLPLYLRFVRGVVDSSELALNVSRELLQQDEAIGAMRTALTRRVLDMLERLAEDAEKYAKFWSQFGALLKEGLIEDFANRDRLAKLMRFGTTKTAGDEQNRAASSSISPTQSRAGGDLLLDRRVADGGAEQSAPRSVQGARHRGVAPDGSHRRMGHAAPHRVRRQAV